MARARNIKPGLYKNEDLAECSIYARYIFPGMWMLGDRLGRLEDRPKRIKVELLPFDAVDVEPLLEELQANGFILRYAVRGQRYIQILKFSEHQTPHVREQPSTIPGPEEADSGTDHTTPRLNVGSALDVPSTTQVVPEHDLDDGESSPRSPDSLIPSSLIPSSLNPNTGAEAPSAGAPKFSAKDFLANAGVKPQTAHDWLALRKAKSAPATRTALEKVATEAVKAGLSLEAALTICCSRGWQGFNADWVLKPSTGAPSRPAPAQSRHTGFENIDYSEGIENGRIT